MTLKRGLLFTCTAGALLAQDVKFVDKDQIKMAVKEAVRAQTEMMAHKNAFADMQVEISMAKRAMDNWAFAMPPMFYQGGKGPANEEEELKMIAIDSIMETDSERAIPLVEKVLQNQQASMRLRTRALRALGHSNSPKAREVVIRAAKDGSNPELQSQALRTLGENSQNRQLLGEIYASSTNMNIKKQVLRSWGAMNAKDQILAVAKSDANPELRSEAIRRLGGMRANADLGALYTSETSTQIREQILRALSEGEDWQRLLEIAKTEKDTDLRNRAIRQAGNTRSAAVTDALTAMYGSTSEASTRNTILQVLSHQGNAKQIIALARKETNTDLKRSALQHLSRMKGEEVTTYLTELLEK